MAGQHGHTVMVTYPYVYMMYIVPPLAGLGGGILWWLPAYSLLMQIHVLSLRARAASCYMLTLWSVGAVFVRMWQLRHCIGMSWSTVHIVMPRRAEALSDDAHLMTSVCLSHTLGLSREQKGLERLTWAQRWPTSHVTRTPLSRSKGQRSTCRGGHIVAASRTAC